MTMFSQRCIPYIIVILIKTFTFFVTSLLARDRKPFYWFPVPVGISHQKITQSTKNLLHYCKVKGFPQPLSRQELIPTSSILVAKRELYGKLSLHRCRQLHEQDLFTKKVYRILPTLVRLIAPAMASNEKSV